MKIVGTPARTSRGFDQPLAGTNISMEITEEKIFRANVFSHAGEGAEYLPML